MKLVFILIATYMVLGDHFVSSVNQRRIKLVKKGFYPDLPFGGFRQRFASRRYTQEDLPRVEKEEEPKEEEEASKQEDPKKEVVKKEDPKKEPLPSYFETKKPESLEGWLSKPKASKDRKSSVPKSVAANSDKDGYCGPTSAYGIQCGVRMDQCRKDTDCPGVTKCCLVSDCGFLCVKPKGKSKRETIVKKKKIPAIKESATTAEGLKLEDIHVNV